MTIKLGTDSNIVMGYGMSLTSRGGHPVGYFPSTVSELQEALGFGDFSGATGTGGWLCSELSGNLAPAFFSTDGAGNGTLITSNSPSYGITGPVPGDLAVRLPTDGTAAAFTGGDIHRLSSSEDLVLVWLLRVNSNPAAARALLGKRSLQTSAYYIQMGTGAGGGLSFVAHDGTNFALATATSASHIGQWHIGIATLTRNLTTDSIVRARVATSYATSAIATSSVTGGIAESSLSSFAIGRAASVSAAMDVSYVAIIRGADKALAIQNNIAAAIANFSSYISFSI
jgi:hypothetical protein